MIKKLVLENWRSHERSEFNFSKGTNVLVGQMGSGKSTAMEAIAFALFGTFPDLQSRKLKLDEVIMNKPSEKVNAIVDLTFAVNGEEYDIHREIKKGKGAAVNEIKSQGKLLEGPNSKRVTEKICDILKIDYDLFTRAVYSEQNQIEYFLEIPKGQRKQKIDQLLKIDRFENARKNLTTVINRLKDRKDERAKFGVDQKEIEQIPVIEMEIEQSKNQIDQKKEELLEKSSKRAELEKRHTERESKMGEEKKNLREVQEKFNKVEKESAQYKALLEKNKKELEEKQLKLSEFTELKVEEEQALKEAILKIRADSDALLSEKGSYKNKISEIDQSFDKLKGERCPVCSTELNEMKINEIKTHKQDEKKMFEQRITKIAEFIEQKQKELLENEKNINEFRSKLQEKQHIEKEIIEIKSEVELNGKELQKIAETAKQVEKLDRDAIEQKLKEIETDERALKELYENIKEAEKQVALLSQEQHSMLKLIEEKAKRLLELKKLEKEAEKSKKEITYLSDTIESFYVLHTVLGEAQAALRQDFTLETNLALEDVWNRIYPYGDYVNLKLAVDDSGDYTLQLQRRDGEWINVEGTTSGGEKSTACLALRIALSLVLTQNLSWLVLDEPTHNLDREAVQGLAKTLREHLPDIVDQIFIITHDIELEKAASGSLYRLERRKELDEPTKIMVEEVRGV